MRLPTGPTGALILALAIGLLLRVGFATYRYASDPTSHRITRETRNADDQLDYDTTARNLLAGNGFWSSDRGGSHYFSEPAYPVFLAGLYAIGLESVMSVRIAQAVLGILSCVLLYRIGSRLFGPWGGVAAAALLAVNPAHIFYSGFVLSETLRVFAVVGMLWVVVEAIRRGSPGWVAAAGFTIGLVTMARIILVPYVAVVALILGLGTARRWPRRVAYAALVVATAFVAMAPWTLRNYQLTGTFSPVRPDAARLLAGSSDPASGARLEHDPEYRERRNELFSEETRRARDELANAGLIEGATGVIELTWSRLRSDPVGMLSLYAKRALALWQLQPQRGEFAMPVVKIYSLIVNGLTFLLFAIGLVLARPGRLNFLALLFLILTVTGVHLLFETAPVRYRMPADPAVALFAAGGALALVARVRAARAARAGVAGMAAPGGG